MSTILLPIKPQWVEKIFNGTKKYEYRKIKPKRDDINRMIIYSTSPVMKVVGEVEVIEILSMDKNELWNKTHNESGIDKDGFMNYFKNTNIANAYHIGKVKLYKEPKSLKEIGINFIPQSLVYMDDNKKEL